PGDLAPPPGYGYGAPSPGAAPASDSSTWVAVDPQGPQGSPVPDSYSQTPPPQAPGMGAPLANGTY
ncbi:MAG: hypothetical protein WBQ36_07480, partial [Desulfobaccales bacterium]